MPTVHCPTCGKAYEVSTATLGESLTCQAADCRERFVARASIGGSADHSGAVGRLMLMAGLVLTSAGLWPIPGDWPIVIVGGSALVAGAILMAINHRRPNLTDHLCVLVWVVSVAFAVIGRLSR